MSFAQRVLAKPKAWSIYKLRCWDSADQGNQKWVREVAVPSDEDSEFRKEYDSIQHGRFHYTVTFVKTTLRKPTSVPHWRS